MYREATGKVANRSEFVFIVDGGGFLMSCGFLHCSKPGRLVIVGDNKILGQGLRWVLEKHLNIVVVGTFAGPEAVNHAIELSPDVILIDLGPSSVASRLGAIRSLRVGVPEVCVLVLAENLNDPSLVDQATAAGVSGFLPKEPKNLDQILNVFQQALNGRRSSKREDFSTDKGNLQ